MTIKLGPVGGCHNDYPKPAKDLVTESENTADLLWLAGRRAKEYWNQLRQDAHTLEDGEEVDHDD